MLINIDKNEDIIKKYYKILNNIKNINVEYTFEKISLSDDEYKNLIDNDIHGKFVFNNIKDEIFNMKHHYVVKFYDNIIYIFNDSEIEDSIKLSSLIKIIIYLQKIGNMIDLKACFYMSKLERILDNDYFDAKAVNGGYTTFGMNRKMIVWRQEDGIKVFIHELIHYFDIDTNFRQYLDINIFIDKPYKPITTNKDLAFEAFTDFYAINFYMVYLSLIEKNYLIDFLLYNFNKQYNYSLKQAFKIIKYSKIGEGKLVKNNTNVYSYYLLKIYLMIYYRNVLAMQINLDSIDIKKIINNSYKFITNKIILRYIKKIQLDNKLNMVFKQIYL